LPIGYDADWSFDHITLKNRDWVIYTVDVENQDLYNWYFQYTSTTEGTLYMFNNDLTVGEFKLEETGAGESTQGFIGGIRALDGKSYIKFVYIGAGEFKFADLYIGFAIDEYQGRPYPDRTLFRASFRRKIMTTEAKVFLITTVRDIPAMRIVRLPITMSIRKIMMPPPMAYK
jgi:hypothetical protein